MIRLITTLLAFFLVFQVSLSSAQVLKKINKKTKFTAFSKEKYIEELETFLFKTSKRQDLEEAYRDFKGVWEAADFRESKKDTIIYTSTMLFQGRAKAYPDFMNYMNCMVAFHTSHHTEASYYQWELALRKLFNGKKVSQRVLKGFLDFTINLLKNNTLFESRAVWWRAGSDNFTFEVADPVRVRFGNTKLICSFPEKVRKQKPDSMIIYETSGVFYPQPGKKAVFWNGSVGKMYWERIGYDKTDSYTDMDFYRIDLTTPEVRDDSARVVVGKYFQQPVLGVYVDRLQASVKKETATFPRFSSYSDNIFIADVLPNINYKGGVQVKGVKLIGKNMDDTKDVSIFVSKGDSTLMHAFGKSFVIKPTGVTSLSTKITIPLENDSIFHPGVQFSYNDSLREVELMQDNKALSKSYYFNSYHDMDFNAELLQWNIDGDNVVFKQARSGITTKRAMFRSETFFDKAYFRSLQGADKEHPLKIIRRFTQAIGREDFKAIELSNFLRRDVVVVRHLLLKLAVEGFLSYDNNSDIVNVNKRLYNWLDFSAGKKDYDVIFMVSDDLDAFQELHKDPFGNVITPIPDSTEWRIKTERVEGKEYQYIVQSLHGKLNLSTRDLNVSGIDSITVSSVQNVVSVPTGGSMTLKKDGDFSFDGVVKAGLLEYVGVGYYFDKKNFTINMDSVSYMRIKVNTIANISPEGDTMMKQIYLKSNIHDITGQLLIDDTTNMSGLKKKEFSQFPIFKSQEKSYVYYDEYFDNANHFAKDIQAKVYDKEKFFFEVDPYELDSLENFKTDSWQIKGTFTSNIFPTFREKLTIMTDSIHEYNEDIRDTVISELFSLGFERRGITAREPLYGGKGEAQNDLVLSNLGLRGNGNIYYLTTSTKAEEIMYYLDSTVTKSMTYQVEEQDYEPEYAGSEGEGAYVQWYPYKDSLVATTQENAISMFDETAGLFGSQSVTPNGHYGWGTMDFLNAKIYSDFSETVTNTQNFTKKGNKDWGMESVFRYKSTELDIDTCRFEVTPDIFKQVALNADNYKGHIDFDDEIGNFETNGELSKVELPINQYISKMDKFTWDVAEQLITIGATETDGDGDRVGSEYISVHPDQDSLRFMSKTSKFGLEDALITASEVDSIIVVDGAVYPSTDVIVDKDAKMHTLEQAQIIVDSTLRYHRFYNSVVNILGRYAIQGNGDYDYLDEADSVQTVHFAKIDTLHAPVLGEKGDTIDWEVRTYANGEISEVSEFTLSPAFGFYGTAHMYSQNQFLTFAGATKIFHPCENLISRPLSFISPVDPDTIYIPMEANPKDIDGQQIMSSFFLAKDSTHIYPAFLSKRGKAGDVPLIPVKGYLTYDETKNRYKIGLKEKLLDPDLPGNLLSLNNEHCILNGEGKIDLGVDLGLVKLTTVGSVRQDVSDMATAMGLLMGVDFFFLEAGMEMIAEAMIEEPSLNPVHLDEENYIKAVVELVGAKRATELREELISYGQYQKAPKELNHTITFADISFEWNEEAQSYMSIGDKGIGVGSIGKEQINKYVKGNVEIVKKRSGDEFKMYIEVTPAQWYFFQYSRGKMVVFSRNGKFNEKITELKEGKRKAEKVNDVEYLYEIGSESLKRRFMTRIETYQQSGKGE